MAMIDIDHAKESNMLLAASQLPPRIEGEAAVYPAIEDGVNSIGNAIAAAQVHATLALAQAVRESASTCDHGNRGLCMVCLTWTIENAITNGLGGRS